jgi:hypothetical protein
VLLIDATYKINKNRLPLVHLVEVTAIGTTFTVALAFVSDESEETYYWVFSCIVKLYRQYSIPLNFVWCTDVCWGAIKAGSRLFPGQKHNLCWWHMTKNVEKRIKELRLDIVESVLALAVVKFVFLSEMEETYQKRWLEFELNTISRDSWTALKKAMDVSTVAEEVDGFFQQFEDQGIRLIVNGELHEQFLVYVENTWVRRWKKCLMKGYTDQYLHRG